MTLASSYYSQLPALNIEKGTKDKRPDKMQNVGRSDAVDCLLSALVWVQAVLFLVLNCQHFFDPLENKGTKICNVEVT